MAASFRSRFLRHMRDFDVRFVNEQREIARLLGRQVIAAGRGIERTIPNTRQGKEQLKLTMWSTVLKPYYIGTGNEPFNGSRPQSPFAQLLYDGIVGSIDLVGRQQASIIERYATDERVLAHLTSPTRSNNFLSELSQREYDPFHLFVDPNGYRLSDRVWQTAINVRSRIDRLLEYHIAQGTSAVEIADLLEDFLTPGARLIKTRTPYGREGSYAARRLARTEISAAAGRATVNASNANPFVRGIQWKLSPSHKCCDICDDYARGGIDGDGVYPPNGVPTYPAHPHDLCTLLPVPVSNPAEVTNELLSEIQAQSRISQLLQGLFNPAFIVSGMVSGLFNDILERLRRVLA